MVREDARGGKGLERGEGAVDEGAGAVGLLEG